MDMVIQQPSVPHRAVSFAIASLLAISVSGCSSKSSSSTGEHGPREPVVDSVLIPEGSAAPPRARGNPSEGYRECEMEGLAYLDRAKITEALNTLGALVRDAQAAYERERTPTNILGDGSPEAQFTHDLCKSSSVVPLEVPRGGKTQPSATDFGGDAETGWKCLKFVIESPIYFQYRYTRGSGYLGPSRGLPNPGPDGFEVSAIGDLDGDGRTSIFTRHGVVNRETSTLTVSTQVFCEDPDE